jgi:hypothetical protein
MKTKNNLEILKEVIMDKAKLKNQYNNVFSYYIDLDRQSLADLIDVNNFPQVKKSDL